jgi:hypothetical protein
MNTPLPPPAPVRPLFMRELHVSRSQRQSCAALQARLAPDGLDSNIKVSNRKWSPANCMFNAVTQYVVRKLPEQVLTRGSGADPAKIRLRWSQVSLSRSSRSASKASHHKFGCQIIWSEVWIPELDDEFLGGDLCLGLAAQAISLAHARRRSNSNSYHCTVMIHDTTVRPECNTTLQNFRILLGNARRHMNCFL